MRDTVVEAYGRLHFALIDLGRTTARAFGGCGVAISLPVATVSVVRDEQLSWHGLEHIDEIAQEDLGRSVKRLAMLVGTEVSARVAIQGTVRQHVGLGSKTALVLAILTGLNRELGLSLGNEELQRLSGRGGASGVGIHTFFCGGFVVDGGHPQSQVEHLVPSGARRPTHVPPLMSRLRIPASWRFWLLLPPGPRIAGEDEAAFFARNTPVASAGVYETLGVVAHGVAPAVATADLEALSVALRAANARGFKACEVREQSEDVRILLEACWSAGEVAAGLSSMGPLVYVIGDTSDLPSRIRDAADACGAEVLGPIGGRNHGAMIDVK